MENISSKTKTPRGLRNNNPLNIIHSKAHWQGMNDRQTDPNFVQFKSMEWGIRAAVMTLRSYHKKGYKTVQAIVQRWCPDHTAPGYIRTVCNCTGWNPSREVNPWDIDDVCNLLNAMIKVENGTYISMSIIRDGYKLIAV